MGRLAVFIDTNVLLHCQLPDQIPWTKLARGQSVLLVIARVVIQEIDKYIHDRNTHKRERALAARRWLLKSAPRDAENDIREGVAATRYARRPRQSTYDAHGLDPNHPDDQLAACILEYRDNNSASGVAMATRDVLFEDVAASLGIDVVQIPDCYALPPEEDPRDAKIKELRKQVDVLSARLPKLTLALPDAPGRYVVRTPWEWPSGKLEQMLARQRKRYPLPFPEPDADGAASQGASYSRSVALASDAIRSSLYGAHQAETRAYHARYEEYLTRDLASFVSARRRTVRLRLRLVNDGSLAATDVSVILDFAPDLRIADEDSREGRPSPPSAPLDPMHGLLGVGALTVGGEGYHDPLRWMPDALVSPNVHGPWLNEGDQGGVRVEYRVKRLRHGREAQLDTLWVTFPSCDAAEALQVPYCLSAAELPEPTECTLDVPVIRC